MKLKTIFVVVLTALISVAAYSQNDTKAAKTAPVRLPSARKIIQRHITASGGVAAFKKIKTRSSKGTLEMQPVGIKGTFETLAAAPNRSLAKLNLAGIGELTEGYDGTTAWSVNPIQGSREKSGSELLQARIMNDFYRDIRLEKIYPKMTVTGIEKVGGKDVYVIRAEPMGLPPDLLYFEVASGLLVRTDSEIISPEGKQKAKIFIENYKRYDGLLIPTRIRTVLSQFEMTLTSSEIKNNIQIDETRFAKPKK